MSNKSFQETLSASSEIFGAPAENQVSIISKETERKILSENKTFDITQHEWSDVIAEIEPESIHTLVIKSHGSWISFDKDDIIAMAKDRGVTAEDLA